MEFKIDGKTIKTNEQGFLEALDDWSEGFTVELAKQDGVELFVDHWELIWYFREYYEENAMHPSMHTIVQTLGKMKGDRFHDQKEYSQHLYSLFPTDTIHEICKLAGLPMPAPDT